MLITNHVVAGALVGAVSPGPATAFGLGVASHFAMDALPHWGDNSHPSIFLRVAVRDGLVGLAVMGYLARTSPPSRRTTVVAGMLGACLPDADKPGRLFLGGSPFPRAIDAWHMRIQHESPRRMPQEVAVAASGLLAARLVLSRAGRRAAR